jgi:Ras family protein T1
LFQTAPSHPWTQTEVGNTTVTDDKGAITLQGFLALLSMTTLLSYKTTLAYLAYLGYPHEDTSSALKVIKKEQGSKRNVFLCYIFGATGSGKTSFMYLLSIDFK